VTDEGMLSSAQLRDVVGHAEPRKQLGRARVTRAERNQLLLDMRPIQERPRFLS
jgi:hypothetical protein